ncbi:MAG: ImmA/IrrE family metallo-endopeptidase [Pseudonocardiaceae bacterium]
MSREDDLRSRVRQVIDSSGRTRAAFARGIDLDPTKLSKALAGKRRFTPLELTLIAEQGQTSTDWLLHGPPERPSLAARAHQVGVSDAAQEACARAEELNEVHETLAPGGRIRAVPLLPHVNPKGGLIDQGTALAEETRDLVERTGTDSSQEARDGLPATIEHVFGIDVGIEDLPPGFDGLSWCRNGFRLILVSNAGSWTRQRFTLAHELGHVLAGDAQDLQVDIDVMSSAARHGDSEMRANAFAAAFLMPAEVIDDVTRPVDEEAFARLVGVFGVSPSALSWRLLNMGIVNDGERCRLGALALWDCATRGGWLEHYRALTRDQSEIRRPGLLSREVIEAFEAGRVSARVAARVLDVPPETLLPALPLPRCAGDLDDDLVFVP